jgi:16S rRNA (guanine(966)-N(2))-methyltransferase RsmD
MRAMPHARAQIMLPSSRVATPPSTSCARPRAVPDRRRRHRASIPFPRRSLAPRAKRQYDSAADAEEDLLFWNEEDLEDDDPIAIEDEEDWDDEDDDEDDDWFFVPEGANVRVVNEDLFNIDDEDNGGGYVMDFVRVPTKNDRASGSSEAVNTSLKSPKKNPRGVASADAKPKRVVGESSEINAKRDDKGMKKEDIERMVRMGVPRDLLFAIEEEKQEVAAFNKKKEYEATRKTHKRMTIVAGKYARRKLLSPSGLDTRPMMSMVRGATFDMMLNFLGSRSNVQFPPDSRWLDMFCGTGAIGIESISRGVVEAHFVEMDPWVVNNVTNKNLNSLGLTKQTTTHTASVQAFMNQHHKNARGVGGAFDFISFCPPYEKVSYPELLLQLDESALVKDSTILLVEYAKGQARDILPSIGKRLRRVRDRRYGRTFVALYVCDGRDIDGEDDDEGPEVATKFAKPVRRGRRRDDDDDDE